MESKIFSGPSQDNQYYNTLAPPAEHQGPKEPEAYNPCVYNEHALKQNGENGCCETEGPGKED